MEERSVERFFVPSSVSDVGMNPNRCFRSMEVNKPEGKPSVKRLGNLTSIWNEFVAYLSKKQIQTRYEEENMSGRESHSAILKQFSGFLAETDFGSHEEASDVLELDSAELGRFGLSSHLLVIFSISRSVFPPRELIQSTVVRAKFETTNPSMVVQKCGMRLVYDQDVGWFTRVTEHDVICLDQVEISTPLGEAHWLCQSLEWEKIIPPLEEETTVLVLRKDLESVLPRYLEFNPSALNCYPMMFKFNLGGSPGWFCEGLFMWSNSAVMPMELPENLHKSKKWMGLAIFASLVEEVGQTMKEDNYLVHAILTIGDKFLTVVEQDFDHVKPLSEEHHQLLVLYIPAAQIPEEFLMQTLTTGMDFEIMIVDSPQVHRCGFRIVCQEDIQGFSDTIIRCMQRDNSLESYDKLVVEEWIELIQWEGAHLTRMTERDSRTPREKYLTRTHKNIEIGTGLTLIILFIVASRELTSRSWNGSCLSSTNATLQKSNCL